MDVLLGDSPHHPRHQPNCPPPRVGLRLAQRLQSLALEADPHLGRPSIAWSPSTPTSSPTRTSSSATKPPRTSASKRATPSSSPPTSAPKPSPRTPRCRLQAAIGELEEARLPPLHLAGPHPLSRERRSQRPLVSGAPEKQHGKPKQAIIVMPQWNADAFSHNALCTLFNRFGISALRLSKPYHDIRRPAELERSDYAVSANIGRTIAACRQAVVDIRSCLDWLRIPGLRAVRRPRHQPRQLLRLHRRRPRSAPSGLRLQPRLHLVRRRRLDRPEHPPHPGGIRAGRPHAGPGPRSLHQHQPHVLHGALRRRAKTRSGSPRHLRPDVSPGVLARCPEQLRSHTTMDYVSKVLPCGHYTTGETPYKYVDGWYLGPFSISPSNASPSNPHPPKNKVQKSGVFFS